MEDDNGTPEARPSGGKILDRFEVLTLDDMDDYSFLGSADYSFRGHSSVSAPSLEPNDLISTVSEPRQREGSNLSFGTPSMTNFERNYRNQQYPGEQEEAREGGVDIHDARDREGSFLQAIPNAYKVERTLGSGHNGIVYAAKETLQNGSQRDVAIKFLSSLTPGHVDRKMREITAHGFLPPHPYIVELYLTARSDEGYEFFVMELCDSSLDQWISQRARGRNAAQKHPPLLRPNDVVRLLHELCDVILALKEVGMVHRDIKPSNILLAKRSDVGPSFPYSIKLADFGVADMQIGSKATSYDDTFMGAMPKNDKDKYTAEDDFRAAASSIFFAWLGEARWGDKAFRNSILASDNGFYLAISRLVGEVLEGEIVQLFERILPIPRYHKTEDDLDLLQTVKELERMGEAWSISPKLERTQLDLRADFNLEGGLNNAKLDLYVNVALDIVSGRRKAKDWKSAQQFLDRARFYIDQFQGPAPDALWCQYYFQRALTIELRGAQDAVRDFIGTSRKMQPAVYEKLARDKAESALRALQHTISLGEKLIPSNSVNWKGTSKAQYANLKGLWLLEEVKYNLAHENVGAAEVKAKEGVQILRLSLQTFTNQDGAVVDAENEIIAFQHYRNEYLFRHELIIVGKRAGKKDDKMAVEAAEHCKRGVRHVMRSTKTSNADKLEMQRCYAEAQYISGDFAGARQSCRLLFDEYAMHLPSRAPLLRVIAVWVATLRALCEATPGSSLRADVGTLRMELGFVCGLLTTRHRDAAAALVSNSFFVLNGRAFLASDEESAIAAAANPLLPIPLLPNDELILSHGKIALATIEQELTAKQPDWWVRMSS